MLQALFLLCLLNVVWLCVAGNLLTWFIFSCTESLGFFKKFSDSRGTFSVCDFVYYLMVWTEKKLAGAGSREQARNMWKVGLFRLLCLAVSYPLRYDHMIIIQNVYLFLTHLWKCLWKWTGVRVSQKNLFNFAKIKKKRFFWDTLVCVRGEGINHCAYGQPLSFIMISILSINRTKN